MPLYSQHYIPNSNWVGQLEWIVHNMGFYNRNLAQHFGDTRPTAYSTLPASALQEAQLDQPRCTLPVQRAWWRVPRRAEWRRESLTQRKEDPVLRSNTGGEPLKVGCGGHWANIPTCRIRAKIATAFGRKWGRGNRSEVKLEHFHRTYRDDMMMVDTFPIKVFAWWWAYIWSGNLRIPKKQTSYLQAGWTHRQIIPLDSWLPVFFPR